jgi:hypothetical protein
MVVSSSAWAQTAAQPDKIYSRQKAFKIPFQIPDPSEQKQLQEVQLYVARDGGIWEKYTSSPADVPADKRSFVFRTDQDGEFWFAVRTIDRRGTANPESETKLQSGLKVVVDSEVPKIVLRPAATDGREVGVEWEVQDRNVDVASLKLEYRVEGQEIWQVVPAVVPKFIGQAVWTPDQPGKVSVRCQIQDRAQNLGIQTIDLAPAASAAGSRPDSSTDAIPTSRQPESTRPALGPEDLPTKRPPFSTSLTDDSRRQRPAAGSRTASPLTGAARSGADASEPSAGMGLGAKSPVFGNKSPVLKTESAPPPAAPATPEDRQIVHDPEVSLDYEVEDEGPSGVSVIELWVTTDQGHTWKRVGEDADRRSPFTVNLGGDGIYGLTMVAKSGAGLGDRPPAPGDEPQTWVEVDTTAPQVRLLGSELGAGVQSGTVTITWQASDANLGNRCVSLYVADSATGEWKAIASGVDNVGRYVWKPTGPLPSRFRVAVEVSDLAGNSKSAESAEITIDVSRPRPRISRVNAGGAVRR